MMIMSYHPKTVLFIFFLFLTFLSNFHLCFSNVQNTNVVLVCSQTEKESLLTFKESVRDPSGILSSWSSSSQINCCMWERVVCNNINLTTHVLQLHLHGSISNESTSLSGKINPSLLNLKHLTYLDLSGNYFEESIPAFIGSFVKLDHLDLSYNGFYGTIPNTLGNLSSLRTLNLSFLPNTRADNIEWLSSLSHMEHLNMAHVNLSKATNWLEVINDNLPSLVELNLANCSLVYNYMPSFQVNFSTSLAILDLSSNNLGPDVPRWISKLNNLTYLSLNRNVFQGLIPNISYITKLRFIDLGYNYFQSKIPDWIYTFKSLQYLGLNSNLLFGPISVELGNLSSLTNLMLDGNKLTGNLPVSVGQLTNLKYLSIENNMLEGIVSERHFANLANLEVLHASQNRLTLEVELNWTLPSKLFSLEIGSWKLTGDWSKIPSWLELHKDYITCLDLSNTGVSFQIPSWFWGIENLQLANNNLHGSIPANLIIYSSYINMSSNRLSGSLPRISYEGIVLDLSNNSFSGDISEFICNTISAANETYTLRFLHVGGNLLSGALPTDHECWMKWSSLKYLDIGNNNISGIIPNSIGLLTNLQSLNLNNNSLSGGIPSSIQNLSELVKIDLSDNKLVGSISSLMKKVSLYKLRILIMRSNKLSGNVPTRICKLSFLHILDLSDNILSGRIPRCVDNFTAMATRSGLLARGALEYSFRYGISKNFLDSASVTTKGTELYYDTILSLVTNIDLSRNNLSGEIPNQITSLVELRSLNLSENHFTGLIPNGIGDMKQLESLDLSRNLLSGEIPISIAVLSSLSYMNLSYNNLMGRIPESTQLGSLTASSFIGNKLCGPPLIIDCKSSHEAAEVHDGDRGGKWEFDWFYVFLTVGYAVGFSVVCNTLIFNKSWRDAYYEWLDNMWNKIRVLYSTRKLTISK